MKYNEYNTLTEALTDVLSSYYPNPDNITAVVTTTKISNRHTSVGVQFWTDADIATGTRLNSEGTTSVFLQKVF